MMQLAYVFFVAHFLLGHETRCIVPGWMWGLVEDLVAFENFPWGTYIYSITIYWLRQVLRNRVGGRRKQINPEDNPPDNPPANKQNLDMGIEGYPIVEWQVWGTTGG
ncbi:hypothetical protein ACOSP7_021972 [Xanthoceras sorbifolium]